MRLLVIRRDNIGDLVCTTPLLALLRAAQPDAEIAVLANSYNAAVLDRNPDVSRVFVYTKAKHRGERSLVGTLLRAAVTYRDIRAQRYDVAILAGGSCSAQMLAAGLRSGAARLIGYRPGARNRDALPAGDWLDPPVELRHEVLDVARLGAALGAATEPGPLRVYPDPARGRGEADGFIAIVLGAREPDRRWPAAHFATLLRGLRAALPQLPVALLWAPSSAQAASGTDDDALAAQLAGEGAAALRTPALADLIAALSRASLVIAIDGGPVHLAAALGKPVVALFENRPEKYLRWYPWKTRNRVIVAPKRAVGDIDPEAVLRAAEELAGELSLAR